jgi:hypothetical protein
MEDNEMRKNFKHIILLAGAILCIGMTGGCQKEKNTVPMLEAFGPCPILRGTSITFIGENLDKVTSVTFPDGIEVSDLTKEGTTKLSATVPQEAAVGKMTLNYEGGSITSVSNISYSEPYSISSISPTDNTIREGDVVTIDGDYLNNIVAVVFMSSAKVDSADFISQSRSEITLAVPKEAQNGKIKVVDASENELYSDQELTIAQPAITMEDQTVKAGTLLTIPGTNVDLVASVTFVGGSVVNAEDFAEVTTSAIKLIIPDDAQDGIITATSYAGIEIPSTGSLTMLLPTVSGVESSASFKAGTDVRISGTDLDLVTGVTFSNGKEADFNYADGVITAKIPSDAVDGAITLTCASTKTIDTDAINLLEPTIISFDPVSVVAGNDFTLYGTDLDLVSTVKLDGEKLDFELIDNSTLTVHTTATSASGTIEITAANGDEVESADQMTVTYNSYVIISSMPESAGVDDEITVTGSNFNMVDEIYFGDTRVTSYVSRTDTEMTFRIPDVESGTYNMRFVLFSGDSETCAKAIKITGKVVITELWSGTLDLGTSWGVSASIPAENFADIHPGDNVTMEFSENSDATYWQVKFMDGSWTPLTSPTENRNDWDCIEMTAGATSYTFTINYADLVDIKANGMVLSGYGCTLTRMYSSCTTWKRESVSSDAIMIQDYEPHGSHDASWDTGWSGGTEMITDENGTYERLTSDLGGGCWIMNCNHQANGALAPTLNDFNGYVIKLDVLIPNDIAYPTGLQFQFVYGDGWYWIGDALFPNTEGGVTTHGGWITITIDPADFGWTCTGDGTSGTNGLFIDGSSTSGVVLPAGTCVDNMRFEPKD